jgi:hypothetical protein
VSYFTLFKANHFDDSVLLIHDAALLCTRIPTFRGNIVTFRRQKPTVRNEASCTRRKDFTSTPMRKSQDLRIRFSCRLITILKHAICVRFKDCADAVLTRRHLRVSLFSIFPFLLKDTQLVESSLSFCRQQFLSKFVPHSQLMFFRVIHGSD